MTARLLQFGEAAPISWHRVALGIGRVLAILLAFYLIRISRTDNEIDLGLVLSAGVFVFLYFVFGRKGALRPLMLYLIGCGIFAQVRLFGDQTGIPAQYEYVVALEKVMFFGVVPSVWLQERLYTPGEASPLDIYMTAVYLSYFLSFQVAAFVVFIRQRAFFPTYATAILATAFVGLITCLLLPTAPPWLAGEQGVIAPVHRTVEQLLTSVESSAYNNGAAVAGVNQVAAMPSLHMAMTLVVVLTLWHFVHNRFVRALGALYAASMAFALIYLGEHYGVDVAIGTAVAYGCWRASLRYWAKTASQPATVAARPGVLPAPAAVPASASLTRDIAS